MNEKLIIPASIIIAGAFIAGAIYFSGNKSVTNQEQQNAAQQDSAATEISSKKVDAATDHIQGNPTADIFVVEYSDLECPFCKRYHDSSLAQLKETYKDNERVAFVFRHFPLDEPYTQALHPSATEQHIAAECVAKLGGNEAFFNFIDTIFETTNSDGRYDLDSMAGHAVNAGVDKTAFQTCYNNKDTESIVAASFQEGANAGVQGTPTVYLQTKDGKTYAAVPDYNSLKVGIDAYLSELR